MWINFRQDFTCNLSPTSMLTYDILKVFQRIRHICSMLLMCGSGMCQIECLWLPCAVHVDVEQWLLVSVQHTTTCILLHFTVSLVICTYRCATVEDCIVSWRWSWKGMASVSKLSTLNRFRQVLLWHTHRSHGYTSILLWDDVHFSKVCLFRLINSIKCGHFMASVHRSLLSAGSKFHIRCHKIIWWRIFIFGCAAQIAHHLSTMCVPRKCVRMANLFLLLLSNMIT